MNFFLGLLAIALGSALVKFRESCADTVGEPAWAQKVGGMQMVMVGAGIFLCFWGLATMTGTTDVLFAPMMWFLPGLRKGGAPEGF